MGITAQRQRIRSGYKQTEVGVIPEEWRVVTVKEVAAITTGKRNTQDRLQDGAYPFFVRSQTIERINSYSYDGEAVLTAGDGVGTGKVFHYIKGKFDFHQRVYKISDFRRGMDGFYFYLYFSNHFYDRIMSMTAKSSVDSVRLEMIADMPIPVPPEPEQRAIAAALSDVDELIGALDRLIAKKRDLKQAAMQQLLTGKQRLPGFDHTGGNLKQTEVGWIPEDWAVTEVTDITRSHKQGFYTTDEYVDNGVRLVRITDLKNPLIDYASMPMLHISRNDFDYYKINIGDFLFARSGAIGRYGIVHEDVEAIFGSYIIRFVFDSSKVDNEYFGFLYETAVVWKQLLSITQGSSNININALNIKSITIPLPPIEEQNAIVAILSDMDAEIAALEARRDKVQALKQGMMQQLLTGNIRLI
jgi:type I restriction enzyme S subunit